MHVFFVYLTLGIASVASDNRLPIREQQRNIRQRTGEYAHFLKKIMLVFACLFILKFVWHS